MTDELAERHAAEEARVEAGGGKARMRRQARLGRGTAKSRIETLVDPGTFVELGRYVKHDRGHLSDALASNRPAGDGLRCGFARVDGEEVAVYAHDPTVMRGALGHSASRKLVRLLEAAHRRSLPVLSLVDCDGVRVDEGTLAVHAYGEVIDRTIALRGRVPQLTLVCGLCVGAAAYQAALTDWVAMVDGQSFMFITGAKVTEVVTGEHTTLEDLGAPSMHASRTLACHAVVPSEAEGIAWLKRLLGARRAGPSTGREPTALHLPTDPRKGYDVRKVLADVLDEASLLELMPDFARNLVTGVARLDGRPIAIVASQPTHRAGCLDIDASRKGSRLVRWAGAHGLPLVTFVDVPGYWPGKSQEQGGILVFGAELLAAYASCDTPKLAVVLRKSYGGANVLSYAADYRLALPTAQVAPMGVDAALRVALPPIPDDASDEERARAEAERAKLRSKWLRLHGDVWTAAHEGYFDRVVAPEDLRAAIATTLDGLGA